MTDEEFLQGGDVKTLLVLHPVEDTAAFRAGDFLAGQIFLMGDGDKHLTAWLEDPKQFRESLAGGFRGQMLQNFNKKNRVGVLVLEGQGAYIPHLGAQETGMAGKTLLNQSNGLGGGIQRFYRQTMVEQMGQQISRTATQIYHSSLKFEISPGHPQNGFSENLAEVVGVGRLIKREIFPKAADSLIGPLHFMVFVQWLGC
ncbi:MAG: hypothetical protein WHT07_04940 [Desulfobaccales bacterium]